MASVISFILLFVSFPLQAQIYGADKTYQNDIKKVSNKLQIKKEKISGLATSLAKITKQIDFKKQELETQNKKIESLQDELRILQESYLPLKNELDEMEKKVQKNLKQVIIFNLDKNDEAHDLYGKKLLVKNLKEELVVLGAKKKENDLYRERLKMEEESIKDFLQVRDQLATTLKELDDELLEKKSAVVKKEMEKPEPTATPEMKNKVIVVQTPKPTSKVIPEGSSSELFTNLPAENTGTSFLAPINHFTQLSHNKTGVYFQFQEVGPVRAPGTGEVVFCGELAAYGNVVIIDHGSEIRTVVLGNFYPKIKKNDKLQMGDIIGYTVVDSEKKNTVLFEVRKKMVTQNSIHWLNKASLKKKI